MPPIKTEKNRLFFSTELLQTPKAFVWVGHGYDPKDNDDQRVKAERELMNNHYSHIPYGMFIGNKQQDNSFIPMEANDQGFYELDISWWPEGVYRLNYHSEKGIQSPVGTKLDENKRDQDVSWPLFWENWDEATKNEAKAFMHKEKNGAGYCFRILIKPDRTIEPFGDDINQ